MPQFKIKLRVVGTTLAYAITDGVQWCRFAFRTLEMARGIVFAYQNDASLYLQDVSYPFPLEVK